MMHVSDFDYDLPAELIALYPSPERSSSRLLCLDRQTGQLRHRVFRELAEIIDPRDLLVFNDTRVIPARLYGRKASGGRIEVLIERLLADNQALVQLRASKSPRAGVTLEFVPAEAAQNLQSVPPFTAEVLGRQDEFYLIRFETTQTLEQALTLHGHMPLPPYIRREDELADKQRYQTVYGRHAGAVAAPTAGLHFDEALLQQLGEKGVESGYVTLHVGSGTFQPVRVDNVLEHRMHSEVINVGAQLCEQVIACRKRGGRVIAVGTTTVRSLESAAGQCGGDASLIAPYHGETSIFIYPGYEFRVVDAMITNFHLPQSTLMMLISAFADREQIMAAYQEAIRERYRFFSYGDAMFIA